MRVLYLLDSESRPDGEDQSWSVLQRQSAYSEMLARVLFVHKNTGFYHRGSPLPDTDTIFLDVQKFSPTAQSYDRDPHIQMFSCPNSCSMSIARVTPSAAR